MIKTLADPWLAQNAGRRYPLADDCVTDIPNSAIVDFRCTVRGVSPGRVPVAKLTYIGSLTDPKAGFMKYADVTVFDGPGGARIGTLRFLVPKAIAQLAPYAAVAANGPIRGAMTVQYQFCSIPWGSQDVTFAASTVTADGLKVDSVSGEVRDAIPATGEIVLEHGYNAEPYLDGNRLRIDIYKGAGLGENCQTPEASQHCGNVLFSINGERPGSGGNLNIVGEDGITVTADPRNNAIEIRLDAQAGATITKTCEPACS